MANNTSKLQQWLENIWYHNGKGGFLLRPLSAIYCAVNQYQRNKHTKSLPEISCPIIVVGNITVGGTGKTPLTIHIVQLLKKAGYHPAIITRGYGGNASTWPQAVSASTDPNLVGDEAVLMAQRVGCPVYAGADRLASIEQLLLKNNQCDVIISDDGLQHYKMPRDIQIAVIDASRMLGNELCLPAGPLRERKERLDDCDFIVLNGAESPNNMSMYISGDAVINLKTHQEKRLSAFKGEKVNAVTGIGNPSRFYQTLENAGLNLVKHSFPDHHPFLKSDFDFSNDYPVIMTEKDAVKCRAFATERFWTLPITATLGKAFDDGLLVQLKRLMQKNL